MSNVECKEKYEDTKKILEKVCKAKKELRILVGQMEAKVDRLKEYESTLKLLDEKVCNTFPCMEGTLTEKLEKILRRFGKLREDKTRSDALFKYFRVSTVKNFFVGTALVIVLGAYIFFIDIYPFLSNQNKQQISSDQVKRLKKIADNYEKLHKKLKDNEKILDEALKK